MSRDRNIRLIYWHTNIDNYGDLLSPFLIQELSGKTIVHKNYFCGNWRSHVFYTLYSLIHGDFLFKVPYLFPFEPNIIGIGSILYTGNYRSKIWGAGFMSDGEKCKGGTIYAVRGKYSLEKLLRQKSDGIPIKIRKNVVLGDPALLLPWIVPKSTSKKYKIGIIPHFSEYAFFNERYSTEYKVVNLQTSDIRYVTSEITSCEYILSTSLHGIIVAHAYDIPALWMEYTGLESYTKGFKFKDYFSSVNIPEYTPLKDIESILASENSIIQLFSDMFFYAKPHIDLNRLRQDLVKVAPFPVKEKYKNYPL
ncbi:polysaccharide pyruvyl transferase family protein [uncultured Alistipes sp.]|uniref:polysaccharide pyruvyl transferase family protein n=1 Tax=uncultured Alistipes sp. TaxID=538949 RepID=UPI00262B4982|nr:polysaccharide pyruvyl transferase family protein [uncultured Alistipes sp.]